MDDFDELDDKKQRESNVFREEEETGMPPDGFMNKVQPKPSLVGVSDKLNDGDVMMILVLILILLQKETCLRKLRNVPRYDRSNEVKQLISKGRDRMLTDL